MSTLVSNKLGGFVDNNWAVGVKAGSYLYSPGMILQTVYVRTDTQGTYAAPITGNGTTITPLGVTITPKRANSLLLCTWMLNAEIANTNCVLLIHRDGSLVTTAGYEAYNNAVGNVRYSGLVPAFYDNNDTSTMHNYLIQYVIPASATTSTTIAPAIRSSGAVANNLYLNRTLTTPQAAYEIAVSIGMIQEIAQ